MKRARSRRCAPLIAAGALVVSSLSAGAQVAHWINPAGGSFSDASNWDTAQPPGVQGTAVFDLAADYTVSLPATTGVGAMTVAAGAVSLAFDQSELEIGQQTQGQLIVGSEGGPPATLRLVSGRISKNYGSTLIGSAANTQGIMIIEQGASLFIGNAAVNVGGQGTGYLLIRGTISDQGIDKDKSVYPGSTIHVEGSGYLNARHFMNMGGTLELVGGRFNADTTYSPGVGNIVAGSGAVLYVQNGFECRGLLSLSGGSTLRVGFGSFSGDVVIDGPGSQITGGDFIGAPATVSIRNGGSLHSSSAVDLSGEPRVFVDGFSSIQGSDFTIRGGMLHAEQGALLSWVVLTIRNNPTFEFVLDGAALPSAPLATCALFPTLAGSVRPVFDHPNNLAVGAQVEVLRRTSGSDFPTQFTALDYQPLGGGRQLQLVYDGPSVLLRVVPGGSPCWGVDFNGDGDAGTDADVEAFFACIAGNCCPNCASADFDGDGQEATDGDIEAFFRVLAGGPC
jgi:hypothetical protein